MHACDHHTVYFIIKKSVTYTSKRNDVVSYVRTNCQIYIVSKEVTLVLNELVVTPTHLKIIR